VYHFLMVSIFNSFIFNCQFVQADSKFYSVFEIISFNYEDLKPWVELFLERKGQIGYQDRDIASADEVQSNRKEVRMLEVELVILKELGNLWRRKGKEFPIDLSGLKSAIDVTKKRGLAFQDSMLPLRLALEIDAFIRTLDGLGKKGYQSLKEKKYTRFKIRKKMGDSHLRSKIIRINKIIWTLSGRAKYAFSF